MDRFAVSDLQEAVQDIRQMELPSTSLCRDDIEGRVQIRRDHFVDLRSLHGGRDGIIIASTSYRASKAAPGVVVYGSDGPVKVWVNGREADCRPAATNPALSGQYQAAVRWKRGANAIVFAWSSHRGRAEGLYCGVR